MGDYLKEAEKCATQAMEIIARDGADPQALQRANVLASIAVFMELRAKLAGELTGTQPAAGIVNDRSDLPWRITSQRRVVKDRVR